VLIKTNKKNDVRQAENIKKIDEQKINTQVYDIK
jgi:hypothetical protein